METSDSENFESADEELDHEDTYEIQKPQSLKIIEKELKVEEEESLKRKEKIEELSKEIIEKFSTKDQGDNKTEIANNYFSKKPVKQSKIGLKKEEKINSSSVKEINKENKKQVVAEKCKESQQTSEENMWADDENWEKIETKSINTKKGQVREDNLRKTEIWDDTKRKSSPNKPKEHLENDLWEGDDWDQFKTDKQVTNQKEETHKSEENLWEDADNWSKLPEASRKQQTNKDNEWAQWSSWSNWNNVISKATQSVSTITNQVSQGLTTVIGVPDPEELAKMDKEKRAKLEELIKESEGQNEQLGESSGILNFGGLLKLVETTSTKVISGGLDTLETIGKKTMEVLQEGDPGLKKKRAFLKIDNDKPVLSQLLREAKEKNERENKEKRTEFKRKNYETLFDDHQGLVHLEALEMLSKQCDIKLQNIFETYSGDALVDIQETMNQIKELCELPEDEDEEISNLEEFKNKLENAIKELNINISYNKLIETWEDTDKWLTNINLQICDENDIHQKAIESLAQLTALAVEQFHKTGELLLIKDHRSTVDEADSLVQLTTTLTSFIGMVAAKFSDKLNLKSTSSQDKELVNSLITNVFYEAANSSSYIQDAFQLLIPVLQVGAI